MTYAIIIDVATASELVRRLRQGVPFGTRPRRYNRTQ